MQLKKGDVKALRAGRGYGIVVAFNHCVIYFNAEADMPAEEIVLVTRGCSLMSSGGEACPFVLETVVTNVDSDFVGWQYLHPRP